MQKIDQATSLRKAVNPVFDVDLSISSNVRSISVTSGKGGVGKSNVTLNLAIALKRAGKKVLIFDGDLSLANIDILTNVNAEKTIHDVLEKGISIKDIIINNREGFDMIPSSSGILDMTSLGLREKTKLLSLMEEVDKEYDYLLIDTGAGISDAVTWLNSCANEILIVVTPEPTSIADSYALIKIMEQRYKVKSFQILVNQVNSDSEALQVYNRISDVADRFLNISLNYIGSIKTDEMLTKAIKSREPIISKYPGSNFSRNIKTVANTLNRQEASYINGNSQFFWQALLCNA